MKLLLGTKIAQDSCKKYEIPSDVSKTNPMIKIKVQVNFVPEPQAKASMSHADVLPCMVYVIKTEGLINEPDHIDGPGLLA